MTKGPVGPAGVVDTLWGMPHHDLVILGAGSGRSLAGLATDLDVALVEERKMGGTCLNVGCIPTKMYVLPADRVVEAREAATLGVSFPAPTVDFPAIRDRIFGRIDPISEHHADEEHERDGLTVYDATARFTGERRIELSTGEVLTADRIVVAAGSRPRLLSVPGLDRVDPAAGVHTSDTVMRLDALPERMVIVGGGFIACEFAHVFEAYGVGVTIVEFTDSLLPAEDDEIRRRYTSTMSERMPVHVSSEVVDAVRSDGVWHLDVDGPDGRFGLDAEAVLVAVGRTPNGDRLDAAAGGIDMDEAGRIVVDGQQRTSAPGVWALGDVSSHWPLKHVANHEARVTDHNVRVDVGLLDADPIESDHRFVPHAVFTHPQVAAFGPTARDLDRDGVRYVTATHPYSGIAYGWALGDTEGFLTVYADRDSRRVLAAHCIGPQASVIIQPLLQAASFDQDASQLARGQYWAHPALTEIVENALLKLPFA